VRIEIEDLPFDLKIGFTFLVMTYELHRQACIGGVL
jgi:hypothetical protein